MADTMFAQVSGLLFVVAIVVYVLAMTGFAVDLARSTQRRSDARLERRAATAPARAAGSGSKVAVLDRDPGAVDAGDASARGTGSGVPATGAAPAGGMSAGTFAVIMACGAAIVHVAAVVLRGLATHRVPWSNMYEFAMTGSAVVMVLFLAIILRRRELRVLGTFVVGPMLILMLIAQRMWYVPAAALPPSLQNSHWLVIHVSVAILASALFTIGAVISVLQLLQARRELQDPDGAVEAPGTRTERLREGIWRRIGPVLDRLPSSKDLEALAFRVHAVGFVLWSFTLIFGAIWASTAWGRYWGWDPKEVWTFVIWVVYAAYLHARATVGFRGSRAAWFALVGFLCVIFNFTIVNTVINGLHSYSGLG
ncbi:c-type cytochrome biogenesis protein CcsB [Brachybacterium sp. AOP25-B2-12]|uniref:c-type cytochrome biogenesis protein CcsB n=1 Tax=Brachybacterium sp. AOP25-B2-12 TaxID=3457710 RepID=UPI0040343496